MAFDPFDIRKDFPQLTRVDNGYPLVYLDSTNTSQKPTVVLDAMDDYYRRHCSNVHRSIYRLGEEADALYEGARDKVRKFIGAGSTREIIWTRNATEGINLVAKTWGRKHLRQGDVVVLTQMEHHSNLVPWLQLRDEVGIEIVYVPLEQRRDGRTNGRMNGEWTSFRLDMEAYFDLLEGKRPASAKAPSGRPKLVAVTGMSNVLGTVTPLRQIIDLAHDHEARVLVDAAQLAAHAPVDVVDLDCDFLVMTGHKMLGPTGIGVLYGKQELLEEMDPFLGGGDMIRSVGFDGWTCADLPMKFEAGTPNIAGAIGMGAAVEYLSGLDMAEVAEYEKRLTEYALEKLTPLRSSGATGGQAEVEGLTLFGPADLAERGAIFSFVIDKVHAHDVAQVLADEGICVRAGHHCAQPLTELLGVPATCRASFYIYNTTEEVDRLVAGIEKIFQIFK